MTGETIALLISAFGPQAIGFIRELVENWNTQLTREQVLAILDKAEKSYDDYIKEAQSKFSAVNINDQR